MWSSSISTTASHAVYRKARTSGLKADQDCESRTSYAEEVIACSRIELPSIYQVQEVTPSFGVHSTTSQLGSVRTAPT